MNVYTEQKMIDIAPAVNVLPALPAIAPGGRREAGLHQLRAIRVRVGEVLSMIGRGSYCRRRPR